LNSELEYYGLDIAQAFFAILVMYMLVIYQRFMSKIAKRDDPFSNANILVFIIFCVVLQKYIVEAIFAAYLGAEKAQQATIVVIRQTILAIELLFIIIPIRHNFSLDHVET
jgi:sterol desaturase/sphingolipid hydroxylase (fatty acid hydroxylase superfamily)